MKRIIFLSTFLVLIVICSCKKEQESAKLPTITTSSVSGITATTAISGGTISNNGGDWVYERGVCWSTEPNPSISLSTKTTDGSGNGTFSSTLTGLSNETVYHVRAYATNSAGTAYGEDITFTASGTSIPTITTTQISNITETSAKSGGFISSNGGLTISLSGVCWSTNINPTILDSKTTDGSVTGPFTSTIAGLTKDVVYHVRAYATNSKGTAYGSDLAFIAKVGGSSTADNDHMMLGNPSGAITDIVSANNYLMVKPQYALSYNNSKLTTNWTAWHVYSNDITNIADRQDDFRADVLPTGWYRVNEGDYDYSTYGFDRGHMCPSADRTSSIPNNSATFLMTNMIPQAPNNNQGPWMYLEDYCRSLVNSGNELFIICGPYGQGGRSDKGTFTILSSGVVVPSYTWKIIVVIPNGSNDLSRISNSTRVIAVWMPNDNVACPKASLWTSYRKSVDYIESQTGYDFLTNVSTTIQDVIEAKVDNL